MQMILGFVEFILSFLPSKYQQAILEWVINGRGHGTVNARAGSGKTRTLLYVAEHIKGSCCYLVFNSANQKEAREKFPEHIDVKTIHSAGFGGIRYCLGSNVKVNDSKYIDMADRYIQEAYAGQVHLSREERMVLENTNAALELNTLCRYARVDLVDPTDGDALADLAYHYELELEERLWDFYVRAVPVLLKRGQELGSFEVDFTDMLYLPASMPTCKPRQYDFLLVDECQDLSKAQLAVVRKMLKRGGRALFVGDPNQAIYGFAGADCDSYQRIVKEMNAHEMPLSICYRCDRAIIEEAKRLVPAIEASDKAKEGLVRTIKSEKLMGELKEGDMVLCRTNAPLISLCLSLIGEGIPARIKGRDIGKSLIATAKKISKLAGFSWSKFAHFVNKWANKEAAKILQSNHNNKDDARLQSISDRADCLMVLWERCENQSCLHDLEKVVEDLFSDQRAGVQLSSAHRAKGLENDRVYIIHPELMPGPWAKEGTWSFEQEKNLKYVAVTRAKHELVYVVNG